MGRHLGIYIERVAGQGIGEREKVRKGKLEKRMRSRRKEEDREDVSRGRKRREDGF